MPSFVRNIHTDIWQAIDLLELTIHESLFYLYLITCESSSETSVYQLPLKRAADQFSISRESLVELIRQFEAKGLIVYDWQHQEILVLYYFENHSPIGGIVYEMYKKDLTKIKSSHLLDLLKETSKRYLVSPAFYAALADVFPELEDETIMKQYRINWSKTITTLAAARAAASKGRAAAAST